MVSGNGERRKFHRYPLPVDYQWQRSTRRSIGCRGFRAVMTAFKA
jgi:hypothetical protein